jgi:nitrate reductase NapAB chaperone NapD
MSQRHKVSMLLRHYPSPRDEEARAQLAAELPDAEISQPDDDGVFDIVLDAEDEDQALERVFDAIGASGTDDHLTILEHPDD